MSDLRFARELGAEFERLGHADRRRLGFPSWPATHISRVATAFAVAVPLAIAVLAVAVLSRSHDRATNPASTNGLALSGGNCRTPPRIAPLPGNQPGSVGSDGLVRAAGGRVAGIAWQLRVKPGTEIPGGTQYSRLILGGRQYGLCSHTSAPIPFGLIDTGPHGIVYGYLPRGAGGYRITVSAGARSVATTTDDQLFFIAALPAPACSYRALSVTARSAPVAGLPPAISRSLNQDATLFTTTMQLGRCRASELVSVVAAEGQSSGRSQNAALAHVTAQLKLTAPSGSDARGTLWELAHDGLRGISVLGVGLNPGRYGIWMLAAHKAAVRLGMVTIKHNELRGSYDLPPGATKNARVAVAAQPTGQADSPGTIVLQAALR